MPAFDFPASPSVGQKYPTPSVVGIPTYTWDGEKWTTIGSAVSGGLAVCYDIVQTLTAPQQQQARQNIYAAPFNSVLAAAKFRLFTASGTYTPDPKLICAIVEVQAAGGGGGAVTGAAAYALISGGGGGGSYCRKCLTAAQIGASQSVVIGAGGAGGISGAGGTGGNSNFGASLCLAYGGGGGAAASTALLGNAGPGGAPGTGDFGIAGMAGSAGLYSQRTDLTMAGAGDGGSCAFGPGGTTPLTGFTSFAAGVTPTGYGGGGSGGTVHSSGAAVAGGSGAPGVILITEFCSS